MRIKTNAVRGGIIENIFIRNITVGEVSEAVIKIDFFYEEGDKGNFLPVVRNLEFINITSEKSEYAIWIEAFENSPVENIELTNCAFKNVEKENVLENVANLKMKSVYINESELGYDDSEN